MSNSGIMKVTSRLHHLDSLRGIAALAVAFAHSFQSFYGVGKTNYIDLACSLSPVLFFFLLSGFVLSRSLNIEKGKTFSGVMAYYIRRVFRLYPAALLSMIIAGFIVFIVLDSFMCAHFSNPMNELVCEMRKGIASSGYLCSMNLICETSVFNPPLWTIREEFACSFLLPLLILLLIRFPSMVLPAGAVLAWMLWRACYHQPASFLFSFYLGYMIHVASPHLERIGEKTTKTVLFFALMLWILSIKQGFNTVTGSIVLGVILIVLIPCQWPFLRRMLESSPLRFLGRISYSFYLLHFPIMLLTCSLLASRHLQFLTFGNRFVSTVILFIISVSITLVIGHFSEMLVETPFNRLGRELSSRLLLVSK
jgi:peptidoglycan/LPS O-acetylase OafA/YrhL